MKNKNIPLWINPHLFLDKKRPGPTLETVIYGMGDSIDVRLEKEVERSNIGIELGVQRVVVGVRRNYQIF